MQYRAEIDGLRAISVLLVIAFHAGVPFCSGGYIGVDVFFVISGFLITGIILDERERGVFTLRNFYKRRAARLLPALAFTLLLTYLLGFVLYDELAFDHLGKQIAFAACGIANLLFAQGTNYFEPERWSSPLIHLWSLGVEEQFYLIWPTLLLVLSRYGARFRISFILLGCALSLVWAETTVHTNPNYAYFLPQFRAFELLIGAFGAEFCRNKTSLFSTSCTVREALVWAGFSAIILPAALLDKHTAFPGLITLLPCMGALTVIIFCPGTCLAKFLSFRSIVFIGLISYPLYLLHQPLIAFCRIRDPSLEIWWQILVVVTLALPLSYALYRWCEKPIQRIAREQSKRSHYFIGSLIGSLACLFGIGLFTARSDGLPSRFERFNSFAHDITLYNRPSYLSVYSQGEIRSNTPNPQALFIGDSVLQQYIPAFLKAFELPVDQVDMVTLGGCVLLKGADFDDQSAVYRSADLRQTIYGNTERTYRYVFISQEWSLYTGRVKNFDHHDSGNSITRWRTLIDNTVDHFRKTGATVILMGMHPHISGTELITPTLLITKSEYQDRLKQLRVKNAHVLTQARDFFSTWHKPPHSIVIHPIDIWTHPNGSPRIHDEQRSYFFDARHIGIGSLPYVTNKIRTLKFDWEQE